MQMNVPLPKTGAVKCGFACCLKKIAQRCGLNLILVILCMICTIDHVVAQSCPIGGGPGTGSGGSGTGGSGPGGSGPGGGGNGPGGGGGTGDGQSVAVLMHTRFAYAGLQKCGFHNFYQANPPREAVYHDSTSVMMDNLINDTSGTDAAYFNDCYTADAGPWSIDISSSKDVTVYQHSFWQDCSISNSASGDDDSVNDTEDTRHYYDGCASGYQSNWVEPLKYYHTHDTYSYSAASNAVIETTEYDYTNYWESIYDSQIGGNTNYGEGGTTTTVSLDANVTDLIDTGALLSETPTVEVLTNAYDETTSSTNTQLQTGSTIITLSDEYTDDELYNNIMSIMPACGDWDSDIGDTAYSVIDADHVDAYNFTGYHFAYLQEEQYYFEIQGGVANASYLVTWDIITADLSTGTYSTASQSTVVSGGSDASSSILTLMPPSWDESDYGGWVISFPDNVAVISLASFGVAGTGPGMGSGCSSCGGGSSTTVPDHLSARFSLGASYKGMPAGALTLSAAQPNSILNTPAGLTYLGADTNVLIVNDDAGQLRQIMAPQALADIVVNSPTNYEIGFYHSSQVTNQVGDLYVPAGSPYVRWLIQSANTTNDPSYTLNVTEVRDSSTNQYQYIFNKLSNGYSWTYNYPGSLRQDQSISIYPTNQIAFTNSSSFGIYSPSGPRGLPLSGRQVTSTVRIPGGPVQYQEQKNYTQYRFGEGLVQDIIGTGANLHTNAFTYYSGYLYPTLSAKPPLESVTRADGSWQTYAYDGEARISDEYVGTDTPFPASGTPASGVDSYVHYAYYYSPIYYSDDDGTQFTNSPHQTVISRSYAGMGELNVSYNAAIYTNGIVQRVQEVSEDWTDPKNLVTTYTYYTSGPNSNQVSSVQNPNGTMSFYAYSQATDFSQSNTVWTGSPNASLTAITNGTETVTLLDPYGQVTSTIQTDIATGVVLSRETYGNFDALDRPQSITYLDGTSNQTVYSCCNVESTVDRDGILTYYLYDDLKRRTGTMRLGITTEDVLDAVGHVIETIRTGTDGSNTVLSASAYDSTGTLIAQTNALGGVTTYSQTTSSTTGGLVATTTTPDGQTSIQINNPDGTLSQTGGTAVHGERQVYTYGSILYGGSHISAPGVIDIKLNPDGSDTSEVVTNFFDSFGHTIMTAYAGGGSSESFYNNQGQLWKTVDPDGVTEFTIYDANGEAEYTIDAVDPTTQAIDDYDTLVADLSGILGGVDRVTQTTRYVVAASGGEPDVNRTDTYVWLDGQSTGTLISREDTSIDGLQSWNTQYRDTSTPVVEHTTTVYGTNHMETSIAPDGSSSISISSGGQLSSITRYDTNGVQIGQTGYTYDSVGRQQSVTDARNGATTYTYNNADQVVSTTTPSPGSGQPGETTTTYYDSMSRVAGTQNPDGTTVTNIYLPTGEVALTYGARTYPVGYAYDYAGRMVAMTNWSSFTSGTGSGSRVTIWNYDPYHGFLTNKAYADGRGPVYSYTGAGRLASRTWARTDTNGNPIVTSYAYDLAGDLTNIVYSDGTAGVTNSYNRRGQLSSVVNNGLTDAMSYDLAGDLLDEAYTGGPLNGLAITNQYDSCLRRTTLKALKGGSTLTAANYGYDNASRLATVSDGTDTATYSYLANSSLVGQILFQQSGATRMTTTKQYDYLNRLTQISSTPSAVSTLPLTYRYRYNQANQRTNATLADGSSWAYGYDPLGQVTNGVKHFANGTLVAGQQFGYAFDTIGNRTQIHAGGDQSGANLRVANYYANTLNQLTNRDVPPYVDILGASLSTNAVTVNGQTAYRNQEYYRQQLPVNNTNGAVWTNVLAAVTGGQSITGHLYVAAEPEKFQYDADGNLTNDGRWAYTWDAENRLIGMTVNTNVGPQYQLNFSYDSKGRRIQKVVTTNSISYFTNNFLYDGWNLVATLNVTNLLVNSFMWGNDLSGSPQGAGGVGGLLESTFYGLSTTNCFPAYDGNGNLMGLINSGDGTSGANYDYGPFGELLRATGPMAFVNPFRWSTRYQDDESGLVMYPFRPYNPSTGRWLSRDPIGEPGANIWGPLVSKYNDLLSEAPWLKAFIPDPKEGDIGLTDPTFPLEFADATHGPYRFVDNNPQGSIDPLGLDRWLVGGPGIHWHLIVDTYDDCCHKTGQVNIEFFPASGWREFYSLTTLGLLLGVDGAVLISGIPAANHTGLFTSYKKTTCAQDKGLLQAARFYEIHPPRYYLLIYNCYTFANELYNLP